MGSHGESISSNEHNLRFHKNSVDVGDVTKFRTRATQREKK